MSLVKNISNLCDKNGISLTKLESLTGLHNIYRWDNATPSFDKVAKVADYFGVSVDSIIGRETTIADDLEELRDNPELRTLLSASAKLTKEDIAFVTELVRKMHR